MIYSSSLPFCTIIDIIQLNDTSCGTGIDSDLSVNLTLVESPQNMQSAVQIPNESIPPSAKTHTQSLGVVTDVLDTNQSGGHHVSPVSHLTETSEVKEDTKSSKFLY